MKKYSHLLLLILALACHRKSQPIPAFEPDYPLNRFEETIKNYEMQDQINPIEQGRYLFYGSSSWFYWKNMEQDLAPFKVLNRGFGGSTIPELIYYAERMVYKYVPKGMVIYAGENDMNGLKIKMPEQMLESYKVLTNTIKQRLPDMKFYYVSMKLAPARRARWEAMKQGNELVKTYCKKNDMKFIDINPLLFHKNGLVRANLYTKDSLHINQLGYNEYAKLIKEALKK